MSAILSGEISQILASACLTELWAVATLNCTSCE
jgi:hypothetical protein